MDLNKLRYFLVVAQTEHVTSAAKQLSIAQPALTRALHRFEDELGVKLYVREGRNIRLTPEGAYLKERTLRAVSDLDAAEEDMRAFSTRFKSTVRICINAASVLVVDAIAKFSDEHPDARFEVTQGDGSLFADIVISPMGDSLDGAGGFSERIGIAVPRGDAPVSESFELADLQEDSFIALSNASSIRRYCDSLCQARGFVPRIVFESDNPSVVRAMIGASMGVGFWPEHSWGAPGESCAWVPLSDGAFRRTLSVALTPQGMEKEAARQFERALKAHLARCWKLP